MILLTVIDLFSFKAPTGLLIRADSQRPLAHRLRESPSALEPPSSEHPGPDRAAQPPKGLLMTNALSSSVPAHFIDIHDHPYASKTLARAASHQLLNCTDKERASRVQGPFSA